MPSLVTKHRVAVTTFPLPLLPSFSPYDPAILNPTLLLRVPDPSPHRFLLRPLLIQIMKCNAKVFIVSSMTFGSGTGSRAWDLATYMVLRLGTRVRVRASIKIRGMRALVLVE
jgi:hypothetical protein